MKENTSPADNNDIIDLLPLIQAVWRRKWAIMTLVFLTMVLTALIVMSIKPTYQATATMQIEQEEANVVSIEQILSLIHI